MVNLIDLCYFDSTESESLVNLNSSVKLQKQVLEEFWSSQKIIAPA